MRLTYLSLIGALMLPLLAGAGGGAPHATEQFPGAGHIYFADFGVFDAILDFESDEVLTFTTSEGLTETVQITAIRLRNKLWEVYWQVASGTTVVHVEDFKNGTVRTHITRPTGEFLVLDGTLTKLDRRCADRFRARPTQAHSRAGLARCAVSTP
ncbi:MAG TPA: hypothetical protein VI585_03095 [Candidatus Binatia bacterium]